MSKFRVMDGRLVDRRHVLGAALFVSGMSVPALAMSAAAAADERVTMTAHGIAMTRGKPPPAGKSCRRLSGVRSLRYGPHQTFGRQIDAYDGAGVFPAFDRQRAAMQFDQTLRERQP